MQTLFYRGEDVGSRSLWAWELEREGSPSFWKILREDSEAALQMLDAALPGSLAEELSAAESLEQVKSTLLNQPLPEGLAELVEGTGQENATLARLNEIVMIYRCTTGALTKPSDETGLMNQLSLVFLPDELLTQLRELSKTHGPDGVELRVMPSPASVRVPWELLSTRSTSDPQERLLDICRVVTMAPLLTRDGDSNIPHPDWSASRNFPPLKVIDPKTNDNGDVLGPKERTRWKDSEINPSDALVGEVLGRDRFSELLSTKRSKFLYVGHVLTTQSTAGKAALALQDSRAMYGLGSRTGGRFLDWRYLTAQDLVAGTVGHNKWLIHLSQVSRKTLADSTVNEYGTQIRYPAAAMRGQEVAEIIGRELWPMPPRAGLVACQSGTDLGNVEPFGLVTAILENGAELVLATRWTLLTDYVFQHGWGFKETPFTDMAFAVDELLDEEDLISEFIQWKRERLREWRDNPNLANSPLTWAALTVFHAPDRTVVD